MVDMWEQTAMACIIFFTEFAENGSIYDYIYKDHKRPPMSQILLWATQVAEGMFVEVKSNDQDLCIQLSMHAVGSKGVVWSQVNLR